MVMFLRPTESPVVFLQQLGRGLRTFRGKFRICIGVEEGTGKRDPWSGICCAGERCYWLQSNGLLSKKIYRTEAGRIREALWNNKGRIDLKVKRSMFLSGVIRQENITAELRHVFRRHKQRGCISCMRAASGITCIRSGRGRSCTGRGIRGRSSTGSWRRICGRCMILRSGRDMRFGRFHKITQEEHN